MGYKLSKKEFNYYSPQFTGLRISKESIVGCNYLEASKLIHQQYKRLASEFHSDKTKGSDEPMKAINRYKTELLKYIKPLSNGAGLIVAWETQRYMQLAQQNQINGNDKRTKYYSIFGLVNLFLGISLLASYIYLAIKLFKAANFTTTPGILFSASLIVTVASFMLSIYLISSVIKKVVDLQNPAQGQGENLTPEDIEEALQKEMSEYKFSIFVSQYTPYLSCALLVAGLGLQYQSGCMDSKVLVGLAAVLGCMLIAKLAIEIYERKVLEVVKTEGIGPEQRVPLAMLTEHPSSSINPDGTFHVSAHGVV
ncbi:molecular chaperone DnaJ [Wolbachia endosymbiont of Folsomia candida]|uniref:molecular chaperone DnaJ n=1 Tax=Wolbachia endosymbiont of Folsomia candida TaxID=169402 RepID=UPI000AA83625|nr:molecular chaperone DnaJ [Wolbachia endosymbiont of Folsomia candida]APR98222.1 molecular chaperone DnaJ [Wolbachia endosymbiont of Folsomia candida]